MFPIDWRSRAVMTAATPGSVLARSAWIAPSRACGCGDLSTAPCSIPGRRTSPAYFPRPVSSRGSSLRRTGDPIDGRLTEIGERSFELGGDLVDAGLHARF